MLDDALGAESVELGSPSRRGNLLGIQPWMRVTDYASEEAFFARLETYFRAAVEKGWIGEKTIVLLPEYLGTWLVAAEESAAVFAAPTLASAMRQLITSHLGAFAREFLFAHEKQRVEASLFRLKAVEMARIYQTVFSRLAKQFALTLVAGSILLPDPYVERGQVQAGTGPLYNTCAVFRPDGRAEPRLVKKIFPTAGEKPFVRAARVETLPVFETPAGKLGVLICADSWFPEAVEKMRALGAEILAVPSAVLPGEDWGQLWQGYSGYPEPEDVDREDIRRLNEEQAWDKYALEGRFARSGAAFGMNIFFCGDLWDLTAPCAGRWKMIAGQSMRKASREGAALINLNL
jgi:predicted amidohydrolase